MTSDVEGNYSTTLIFLAVIIFSYLGYESREMSVDRATPSFKCKMSESTTALERAIVSGLHLALKEQMQQIL
jgi:hypothetical protein